MAAQAEIAKLQLPAGALPAGRVRPLVGEAGARDRAARVGDRDAGEPTRPSGSPPPRRRWRRRSRPRSRRRSRRAGRCPSICRAKRCVILRACACPHCGGALAADRRGRHRDPRLRAGPLQGDPACPREALLPRLRYGRRGAGARSRDRARPRRRRAAGPHRRVEVRRSSAALPPGRDLRPRGRQPGDLDPVRLGRGDGGGAASRWSTRSPPR